MKKIGIILLAAGASRRMGQAKQLLKINATQTLIEYTISTAQAIPSTALVLVLGANATAIQKIVPKEIPIRINKNWAQGMGTSLQTGLQFLLQKMPDLSAVIISVCDQPYLKPAIFEQLISKYTHTPFPIISADYGNKLGVPALLDQQFFSQLLALKADEGARKIIRNNPSLVGTIPFAKGAIDIDTPEAYQAYLDKNEVVL